MNLNEGRLTDKHPSEGGARYADPEHHGNEKANKAVEATANAVPHLRRSVQENVETLAPHNIRLGVFVIIMAARRRYHL